MMNITLLWLHCSGFGDTLAVGNPALTPASRGGSDESLDMAMKGVGWIMPKLALLSVVCFYIFFERMAVICKAGEGMILCLWNVFGGLYPHGEIKSYWQLLPHHQYSFCPYD